MTYKHILNEEREIKRNESNFAHKKYLNRKCDSHCFYLKKIDKQYSSIEISLFKMKQDKLLDLYPSIRQIYNWIRSDCWIIKWKDKLRIYCKNRKRKNLYI